jgi:hypothetical protein
MTLLTASNFAIIARPLHKMCEKGSIFQWNDECEQVFIRLKDVLTSPGRQHNNADALSRTPCKVCLRHHPRFYLDLCYSIFSFSVYSIVNRCLSIFLCPLWCLSFDFDWWNLIAIRFFLFYLIYSCIGI